MGSHGKGDNHSEPQFDRHDKNLAKAEEKAAAAFSTEAFGDKTGLHLNRDQAAALTDNMVAMARAEGMSEKDITHSLNDTVKNLNRILDFMTSPDPQTKTSFIDRLSKYDKEMANNLMESVASAVSTTAQLQDYSPDQARSLMSRFQTVVSDRQL